MAEENGLQQVARNAKYLIEEIEQAGNHRLLVHRIQMQAIPIMF